MTDQRHETRHEMICPTCAGSGVVPLPADQEAAIALLYELGCATAEECHRADTCRHHIGVTAWNNRLMRLKAAGCVRRVRAGRGYRWYLTERCGRRLVCERRDPDFCDGCSTYAHKNAT